jgi:glycosyltransferase involved in cell wall biosynthesis
LLKRPASVAEKSIEDPSKDSALLDARVVLLTNIIPPYQLNIFEQLARTCREFHVLLSTISLPNRRYALECGSLNVTVQKTLTIHQKWKHYRGGFEDTLYVHFPLDTYRLLRKLKPDIILSFELGFRSFACTLYRICNPSCRLILCTFMSTHTEQGRGIIRSLLRKWLVRRADAITYNGPECLDVLRSIGVSGDKLFQFGYAAHPIFINNEPVKRSALTERRLLYIGQISERKGVAQMMDYLTSHAAKHPELQLRLTVVGEGPLRELLASLDTPANFEVEFAGNIPVNQLPEIIREHGALIFPTLGDEWGLVINEALHAGVPVIASSLAQSCNTLVTDGANGWLFDPREPAEWERAIQTYFDSSDAELQMMSSMCIKSVDHITPEWMGQCALEACRSVVAMPD